MRKRTWSSEVKLGTEPAVQVVRSVERASADPNAVVLDLLTSRYSGADCMLFGGSAAKGTHNATSDIDLVVLFGHLPNARRETFTTCGWTIDAQFHDPETLHYVLATDARLGSAILANFVLEALVVPNETKLSRRAKERAHSIVCAGPPRTDLSGSRYMIFNMLNDLASSSDHHEMFATANELYKVLALHVFRQRGRWLVSRKMIPRVLRDIDATLEREFHNAFRTCFADHDPSLVIALTEKLIPDLSEGASFNWTYPAHHRLKA